MATGIIALLTLLLSMLFWFLKQRTAAAADPATQNQNRYAQIDKDIASGDGVQAGVNGSADLDELDRLQLGKGN